MDDKLPQDQTSLDLPKDPKVPNVPPSKNLPKPPNEKPQPSSPSQPLEKKLPDDKQQPDETPPLPIPQDTKPKVVTNAAPKQPPTATVPLSPPPFPSSSQSQKQPHTPFSPSSSSPSSTPPSPPPHPPPTSFSSPDREPGKKIPFMMVTIAAIVIVFGFVASFLFFRLTDSKKQKKAAPVITPPAISLPSPTIYSNPFATESADYENPFATESGEYENPFGEDENPFSFATESGTNNDQPYQNPFE